MIESMKEIYFVINFAENEYPYILIFRLDDTFETGDVRIIFSKALAESVATDPLLDAIHQVCAETGGEYEIVVADDSYGHDGDNWKGK